MGGMPSAERKAWILRHGVPGKDKDQHYSNSNFNDDLAAAQALLPSGGRNLTTQFPAPSEAKTAPTVEDPLSSEYDEESFDDDFDNDSAADADPASHTVEKTDDCEAEGGDEPLSSAGPVVEVLQYARVMVEEVVVKKNFRFWRQTDEGFSDWGNNECLAVELSELLLAAKESEIVRLIQYGLDLHDCGNCDMFMTCDPLIQRMLGRRAPETLHSKQIGAIIQGIR